jgi:cellulose synthase/poly-beta-1,6-N-acetylglucosamine synthase-like glycosyltransferase
MVVVAALVVGYAFLAQPQEAESALRVLVPMYALSVVFILLFVPLVLLGRLDRFLPEPGDDRPPVDVIVPAYNEEENLARLLRSIDVAAQRYGGPVRLVVSNDGSVDATEAIARAEIARMRFVRGEVLSAPNGGQAAALNRGLAITDADICVRVDADCVMGEDALLLSVPWFRDPRVGTVGAIMMPRTDVATWFHRLRALETLFQFRFARRAQSVVDGIMVIPGTFTAFRRRPVVDAGGFPTGMNGEDADLTMQIGRLGYRAVVDPRITSFEDVPRSAQEFLEQRTRWARAGIHVFARHNPFCVGSAGPRVWFWTLRRSFSWFSIQTGLVAPVYIGGLALTHPTYRRTIATVTVLYLLAGALSAVVTLPLAIRHRQWRSILWMPTWFAYAFLRRLAMLEAVVSLPTRPLLAGLAGRHAAPERPSLHALHRPSTWP